MHRDTVETYEARAAHYAAARPPRHRAAAERFASRCIPGLPVADLGCGPGGYLPFLPRPAVALDAAAAMLDLVGDRPGVFRVRADLEALPVRDRSLGGAWARNTYLHVPKVRLPLALARLHWALAPGAPLALSVTAGEGEGPWPDDDIGPRLFARWSPAHLADVVAGAGFDAVEVEEAPGTADLWVRAVRARSLPDTVGPGMRALVVGLNPSLHAADRGIGFARRSNRFWRAALDAGLTDRPFDPLHALVAHGVGMTDLVKRATAAASALTTDEYRSGAARVRRLVEWLHPRVVVFVGLAGWRAAIDRSARPGLQPVRFGGRPAYVMPSTSGLNAHARPGDLAAHLRAALAAAS